LVETEPPVLDNVSGDPFLDTPLDIELNSAIDSVKVDASRGLDGSNCKVIKYLPEEMRKLPLALYSEILHPKSRWENFRPVSLAPCLLKVL
jgi:hypothetical protein